jgi:hypothetical protein
MLIENGESSNSWNYEQYATIRCHNCGDSLTRPMKTIVKMLELEGYATCSEPCRKQVDQELIELLILHGGAIC